MSDSAMMQCGGGRLESAFVSSWEWAKLIATSLVVSTSITATAFALWWWLMK